jgi:hypothetical protein
MFVDGQATFCSRTVMLYALHGRYESLRACMAVQWDLVGQRDFRVGGRGGEGIRRERL